MRRLRVHGGEILFCKDHVQFIDSAGTEIVYWDSSEWNEDPECAKSILNAISIAVDQGMDAVRERLATHAG